MTLSLPRIPSLCHLMCLTVLLEISNTYPAKSSGVLRPSRSACTWPPDELSTYGIPEATSDNLTHLA
jgi:hypothetical protein